MAGEATTAKILEAKLRALVEGERAMPKKIVVYSDGTGQDGGVRPEQRVSNVYK
jgi:hypothetical protein